MDTKQRDKEQIFSVAAEMQDAAERAAYLDDACGDDRELRAEIEELLQHDLQANSMLDFPVLGLGSIASLPDGDPPLEEPGSQIGPYKLLQVIGEGGMGVVYMAEQREPVVRRVALKIIKLGMDTRQVVARFEAERQALAIMDHPNIAKVLDAGTTDSGRPYFAMELVQGLPITEYCDRERLAPRERLELFLPVCQAVQHAHQKGIIHRDIKPSNIMVAIYDGQPLPKVIDFGVAKATGQRLTEKTMFTQYGQIIGTLEYMSPEQARLDQLDIDTRTDIYSLGVLLYELLTGGTPIDPERLRSSAFDEMMRIIREEEPPRPSTRLSTSDALPSVAANRDIEPQQLKTLVHGELDWIVMKALNKERSRRYETASGFADDVQRYLKDEPVGACPPSATYRFGKFVRRNKTVMVLTGMATTALVIGLVGLTISLVMITQEQKRTNAALSQVEEQRERAEGNYLKAREAVDEITAIAQRQFVGVPNSENVRRDLLQKAQAFYAGFLEEASDNLEVRQDIGNAYDRLGDIHFAFAESERAAASFNQAIAIFEQLVADFPGKPEYAENLAESWRGMGHSLRAMGREEDALEAFYKTHDLLEQIEPKTADQWSYRGSVYLYLGQWDKALAYTSKAIELDPNTAWYYHERGAAYMGLGEWDRVVADYSKAIELVDQFDRNDASPYDRRGQAYIQLREWEKAVADYSKAIELQPNEVSHYNQRALAHLQLGQPEKAVADFSQAKELSPDNSSLWYEQGLAQAVLDDLAGYRKTCAEMLERFGQTEDVDTAHWVAWTCALVPEAVSDLAAVVRLAEQPVGKRTPDDQDRNTLGAILYRAGQLEAAIEEFDQLVATWDEQNMPTWYSPAYTWFFLAMAHHRQGNAELARSYLDKATEWAEQEIADNPTWQRKLTLELLSNEAESLIGEMENDE